MPRQKLKRYADLPHLANVRTRPYELRGKWQADYFKNEHPITLELACGKGEYTVELARRFPQQNFIGVDAKGDRLWKGAKTALQEGLHNAAFIRGFIEDLPGYFASQEVHEIWIPFPEPHPKRAKMKRRLTSPRFLQFYRQVLRPGGRIHFKTDDSGLFEFTLQTLQAERCWIHALCEDLHETVQEEDQRAIKTTYEARYVSAGKRIKYVCFSL
jgi:tRNA (guanine-N7-)-methyltransferase